jgi:transcription antitermination factor NusA-like protein
LAEVAELPPALQMKGDRLKSKLRIRLVTHGVKCRANKSRCRYRWV